MSGGFREPKFKRANVEMKELGNSGDPKWMGGYMSKWVTYANKSTNIKFQQEKRFYLYILSMNTWLQLDETREIWDMIPCSNCRCCIMLCCRKVDGTWSAGKQKGFSRNKADGPTYSPLPFFHWICVVFWLL